MLNVLSELRDGSLTEYLAILCGFANSLSSLDE